jgi:hypothetical protein
MQISCKARMLSDMLTDFGMRLELNNIVSMELQRTSQMDLKCC